MPIYQDYKNIFEKEILRRSNGIIFAFSPLNAAYRRQFVLDHLGGKPLIRNADLCEGLGVSPATANRILRDLNEDGTLERVRDGKFWAYQLKKA